MATKTVGDLTFAGALQVRLDRSGFPDYPTNFLRIRNRNGLSVSGILTETGQLWIRTPEITFEGRIAADGLGDLSAWQVGCLQSISYSHYLGHYANGQVIHYRLNTDDGLLKDGRGGSLFYNGDRTLEETDNPLVRLTEVHDMDALQKCPFGGGQVPIFR